MKKKEIKELLELRETQLSNAVNALRHVERMINFANMSGSMEVIWNYPTIYRDDHGVIKAKIGLIFGGSDEQGAE